MTRVSPRPKLATQAVAEEAFCIFCGSVPLMGCYAHVRSPKGLVLLVDERGSATCARRNRALARVFQTAGLATLEIPLLSPDESADPETRGNLGLLAARLVRVCQGVAERREERGFPLGFFAARIGAAVAGIAAGDLGGRLEALVCYNSALTLASPDMRKNPAPTLLIVDEEEELLLDLHRSSMGLLGGGKTLAVCCHEESPAPSKKATTGQLALDWFKRYLGHEAPAYG